MSIAQKSLLRNVIGFFVFIILISIYSYVRLTPILSKTIPYTFDQGRDFLVARDIVEDQNIPFIGPTTGVMGIFHGAWWYYFLAIPYLVFNGNPVGFYFFMFLTSLFATLLLFFFLKREYNETTAFLFLTFTAGSPYLIGTSVFPISSMFTIPFIALFLVCSYLFLKTKRHIYQFLMFLNIGFVLEAEVPAGVFLISAVFVAIVISGKRKVFFQTHNQRLYSFIAFIIPMIPRFLFEIKNYFPQTRALVKFLTVPKLHNPQTFTNILLERSSYFWEYYRGLFPQNSSYLAILCLSILLLGLAVAFRRNKKIVKIHHFQFGFFIALIICAIFTLSLLYKDNFWFNYLEGLSYYYLAVIVSIFFIVMTSSSRWVRSTMFMFVLMLFLITLKEVSHTITSPKRTEITGLLERQIVISRLYEKAGKHNFCVRIYTPPVIPHTYNYLLAYYRTKKGMPATGPDYVNDQCYYIIEDDEAIFRIDQFRKDHIPGNAQLLESERVTKSVTLELWHL